MWSWSDHTLMIPQRMNRLARIDRSGSARFLRRHPMSVTMSDMKTVSVRSLRRDTGLLDEAALGEEILVTRRGKPYVRIVPAQQPQSFLGAGRHLGLRKPVSPDAIPPSEWKGLR